MKIGCRMKVNDDMLFCDFSNNIFCKKLSEDIEAQVKGDTEKTSGKLSLIISNQGGHDIWLKDIYLTLDTGHIERVKYFKSDWGKEFEPHEEAWNGQKLEVRSGRSSKGYSPWLGIKTDSGFVSIAPAWSGNWTMLARTDCCIDIGLSESYHISYLKHQEKFKLFDVYFGKGLDEEAACAELRKYFFENDSLMGKSQFTKLPAVYNTWWCYEDKFVNQDVCLKNAEIASEAGLTHFMLDAGWFGGNDTSVGWYEKRGDWSDINTLNFPDGLVKLGHKIKEKGLEFGIWCEIEAVGEKAALNKTFPEFLAVRDGKRIGCVCMADEKVRKWAFLQIQHLINAYNASWIKFDFNLDIGIGCNGLNHGHYETDGLYAYYLGYYRLLEDIHKAYPSVILENCSSGGLRDDLGILKYTHFTFLSDPDYTEHHFQCFWGALSYIHQALCYHFTQSECIEAHNGIKNPVTKDISDEKFDYMIRSGMVCCVGFSYRLTEWNQRLLERFKNLIKFYKEISGKYILQGNIYRLCGQPLRGGKGDRWQIYQYEARDESSLVFIFRLSKADKSRTIYLKNLKPDRYYNIIDYDTGLCRNEKGSCLSDYGIYISDMNEESSKVLFIKPCEV